MEGLDMLGEFFPIFEIKLVLPAFFGWTCGGIAVRRRIAKNSCTELFVDKDAGLLLRKATDWPTPLGAIRFEVTYGDYRDAGKGVKVPFLVQMIPATPRMEQSVVATVRIQKVEENVAIDDAKFKKPESKAAQPR